MNLQLIGSRCQRTLRRPAEVTGAGFLTGATVHLRFLPAPPSTGVVFLRTDLRARAAVPARIEEVTGTQRRTTLGRQPGQVSLVEHVLSALAGLRVDNCYVELDAPEPPGLDGSARQFVQVLLEAGICLQQASRPCWGVTRPIILRRDGVTLGIHPHNLTAAPDLKLTYFLDYGPLSPIHRQNHTLTLTPSSFVSEIASCRTFILEEEVQELRRQGLGARTTPADLLVFGPRGPIDNRVRFANEPARHKLLDLVGDLSLLGVDLCGHIVAYRSGHQLNVDLARALHAELRAHAPPARSRAA